MIWNSKYAYKVQEISRSETLNSALSLALKEDLSRRFIHTLFLSLNLFVLLFYRSYAFSPPHSDTKLASCSILRRVGRD